MLLQIIINYSDSKESGLTLLKDFSPFILLFLGFVLTNWWSTKEKHNDELKSLDEKTIYFISIIRISISELSELKRYYETTLTELSERNYILPSRNSNSYFMMNRLLHINNVEIYFKIFNKYKGQNNIEQFNEMLTFYDEILTDYNLIFNQLFNAYQKDQYENDSIILKHYAYFIETFTKSIESNPENLKYISILKKKMNPFDLKLFEEEVNSKIKQELIHDKAFNTEVGFSLIHKSGFITTTYKSRIENYKNLFKDLPDLIKKIEDKEILFKSLLENIEKGYEQSTKPIYSDDFCEKIKHYTKTYKN